MYLKTKEMYKLDISGSVSYDKSSSIKFGHAAAILYIFIPLHASVFFPGR